MAGSSSTEHNSPSLPSVLPSKSNFWTPEDIIGWWINYMGPISKMRPKEYWLQAHLFKEFFPGIVELRPSKIHGLGVFAKCDIPAGTVVTCYPADGVLHKIGPGNISRLDQTPESAAWFTNNQTEMFYYMLKIDDKLSIIGNPEIALNGYIGHMVNDAAKCDRPEAEAIYTIVSLAKANAVLCPIGDYCPAVVSLKPIPAGTEVVVSYGLEHWRLGYK